MVKITVFGYKNLPVNYFCIRYYIRFIFDFIHVLIYFSYGQHPAKQGI